MKMSLKSQRILLIDDNSVMRTNIREMLFLAHANDIVEARNAEIALTAMEQQTFDIVLCDYDLGSGKNGQQILEEAKYRNLLPHTALFFMVTALNTQDLVLGAMENKPDDYITKPFNAQQLLTRLEKHVLRKTFFANIDRAIDLGKYLLAIQYCDQLLEQPKNTLHTHLLKVRAELAIKVGDLDTAEQKYLEILQQRELSWARHGLGVIAFMKNDFAYATETFERVIAEAPMLMESYDWLARCYEVTNQPNKAQEILNKAVQLSPQAILRQQRLGALADQSGDLDIAKRAYKHAVDLGKYSVHKSSNDFSSLAKIYTKTNDSKHAIKLLAEMRTTFQQDPEAELRAAVLEAELYTAQNNPTLASEAFAKIQKQQQAIKTVPKELRLEIVTLLYHSGSTKFAYKLANDLITDNIDDEAFINELRALFHDSSYHEQTELFIQRSKQELIELNNKAITLFKEGHHEVAIQMLAEAMEKMPGNKTVLLNLATITLRDMKTRGVSEKKLSLVQEYIQKAKQLGAPSQKINQLEIEFSKLANTQYQH